MDHDRLFKELLTTFFVEFLELFLPEVRAYLDNDKVEFLDKEIFTDITAGDRHEADLVAKARLRGQDTFFLIHLEHQSTAQETFAKRMFRYFARLHEKHDLPIYPIALFSYDAPSRPEPDAYQVHFPDKAILDFHFAVIQLNRLNWRDYVRQPNPIASALMAKMRIATEDRPRVKLECLRLMTTLRLKPAKMKLIGGFVDSYLRLNRQEQEHFASELAQIAPTESEIVMEYTTSWEETGIQKGKGDAVVRLLRRRFGEVPAALQRQIVELPVSTLDELVETLLDFSDLPAAQAWLARHAPQP